MRIPSSCSERRGGGPHLRLGLHARRTDDVRRGLTPPWLSSYSRGMSDTHLVLMDPMATLRDAESRADRVRRALIREGIMSAEPTPDCVLSGIGHPPGPRIGEIYEPGHGEGLPGEAYLTCGVQLYSGKYVNQFGLVEFDWAQCPACDVIFEIDSPIVGRMADAVWVFLESDEPPMVACPSCAAESRAQAWTTQPALGFCYLAVEFWNWPSFHSFGWRQSVPGVVRRALGNPVISAYGRL